MSPNVLSDPMAAPTQTNSQTPQAIERGSAGSVLQAFLKLGLTSFGGPVAHLGYFRDEFVTRREWLDEATYVDIVALCQFLPRPASRSGWRSVSVAPACLARSVRG
jgi:chromate transporter